MATRSTIALEFADGSVSQVYCHWDGYLDHNGRILENHYSDPFKLQKLIDEGDLSSLGDEIGEKHSFDWYNNDVAQYERYGKSGLWCTFYRRDRAEERVDARHFKDFEEYVKKGQREEYDYILRKDGKWYFRSYGKPYESLQEALQEETA